MDIMVIGGGKIGRKLIDEFDREGHSVVFVDINQEIVEKIQNDYDVMGICGSATDVEVLTEAGMKNCDLALCVTNQDEINALCGIMSKKLGAKVCIARIRNRQYFKQTEFMRDELGLNLIVNPEFYAADEIARMIRFPAAIKTETFAKGRIELAEFKVPEILIDKPIYNIYKKHKLKILICAVARGSEVIIPSGDFVLCEGDRIHVTASHADMAKFMKIVGLDNQRLKTATIIGGGRISYYLATQLIESGTRVKIIEQDRNKCIELSEYVPKASIICGDGTDMELLDDEGIDNVDAFVALTGIDEENIVISMYAKTKKVDKVITKVNRLSYAQMFNSTGVDSIVTPKDMTANVIVGYVRAMNEAGNHSEMVSLYRIVNNKAEAVEFRVSRESKFTSKPLKDITFKKNVLIAAIVRNGKSFLPDGNSTIEVGDNVVVVTMQKLQHFEDILD